MKFGDFSYEPDGRIFVPPLETGQIDRSFAYTDGAEGYLLRVLRQTEDLTTDSGELQGKARDWPSQYHIGQGRANLLRALGIAGNRKVLELGSGCGAVSRYLGERCTHVDCVEGSYLRARIGRERCRGLDNTRVFCADINDLTFDTDYDIVTLIGTWEYAPAYANLPAHEACANLLRLAGSALKDDGVLIIAIENKIGLKYWTGWPEDHSRRVYDGIHGYPGKRPSRKSAITFSRKEIEKHLRAAGLDCSHFYFCFPDYKFARTVFSSLGNDEDLYLHNWIDVPFGNPDRRTQHTINEALTMRTLSRAGLLREFANSFLVVASKSSASGLLAPNWIARKISGSPRLRPYRCMTTLANTNGLHTTKEPLDGGPANPALDRPHAAGPLRHQTTTEPWCPGDLLVFDVYEALFEKDFQQSVIEIFKQYCDAMEKEFGTGKKDDEGYPLMRGDCFDFTLRNIVKGERELNFIDTEWSAQMDLPADYLLYRCIRHNIAKVIPERSGKPIRDRRKFTVNIIKAIFPGYDKRRYAHDRELDKTLTGAVTE